MDPKHIIFARRYRIFLYLNQVFSAIAPEYLYPLFIHSLARWMNPFRLRAEPIKKALLSRFSPSETERIWRSWLDSHSLFALNFFNYVKLNKSWLKNDIDIDHPSLIDELKQTGGLLLTYHTHHQNTLCCALGLAGCEVSAIAAAPEDSPLFPFIGRWAQRVNSSSAQHFGGGSYLFIKNKRLLARSIRRVLSNKKVLVCLCDFHQPRGNSPSGEILGKRLSPPTGTIEWALRQKAPIFLALLAPGNGRLRLRLRKLDPSADLPDIVTAYLAFLASCIEDNPACWQGWDWLHELPPTE